MIASIPTDGEHEHLNLHFDEVEFLTARRQHVQLFDLLVEGEPHVGVVRELQWDALGDRILHVEFKRVQRGVATESEVELRFYGQVKEGVLTQSMTQVTISSIPSKIPNDIEVSVEGLVTGTHLTAGDLVMPEGVTLLTPPETEIAVVGALRGAAEALPVTAEEEEAAAAAAAEAAEAEGEAPEEAESEGDEG